MVFCTNPKTTTLQPETIEYPPVSPDLSGSWTRLLRVFGPGAIIASVTVGTGETIFAPRVGALFGYAMLWVILATVPSFLVVLLIPLDKEFGKQATKP